MKQYSWGLCTMVRCQPVSIVSHNSWLPTQANVCCWNMVLVLITPLTGQPSLIIRALFLPRTLPARVRGSHTNKQEGNWLGLGLAHLLVSIWWRKQVMLWWMKTAFGEKGVWHPVCIVVHSLALRWICTSQNLICRHFPTCDIHIH